MTQVTVASSSTGPVIRTLRASRTRSHCRLGVWSISICAGRTATRLLGFQAQGKCSICVPSSRPRKIPGQIASQLQDSA